MPQLTVSASGQGGEPPIESKRSEMLRQLDELPEVGNEDLAEADIATDLHLGDDDAEDGRMGRGRDYLGINMDSTFKGSSCGAVWYWLGRFFHTDVNAHGVKMVIVMDKWAFLEENFALFCMFISAAAYSSMGIFVKLANASGVPAFQLVFIR